LQESMCVYEARRAAVDRKQRRHDLSTNRICSKWYK